jgi:hypothetical protein
VFNPMSEINNLSRLIVTLVTVPFILILTVINIGFIRSARKATASQRWPSTTGRILTAQVTSHRSLNSSGTYTTIYKPQMQYEYTAEGQRYQSSQLSYSMVDGMSAESWAEGIVDRYQPGSSVEVYYNPAKPDDAVLEHSGGGLGRLLVLILGGVELILVVILVLAWTGRLG